MSPRMMCHSQELSIRQRDRRHCGVSRDQTQSADQLANLSSTLTSSTAEVQRSTSFIRTPLRPTAILSNSASAMALVRNKTAALKLMSLESAKMPRSHGIALLRLTLFFSSILLVLCLHTEMLAKGQLVHDCKSTPSLRNVNEVRKFVDNCIKTKDGIRFRKRLPAPTKLEMEETGATLNGNNNAGGNGGGGDLSAEYGGGLLAGDGLEGGQDGGVPIELLSSGSTTPLPGKGAVQQLKAIQVASGLQSSAELLPQPSLRSAPLALSPQLINEKQQQQQQQQQVNNGGPPPAFRMMQVYFRDLARQRLQQQQRQQQLQQQRENIADWNSNDANLLDIKQP